MCPYNEIHSNSHDVSRGILGWDPNDQATTEKYLCIGISSELPSDTSADRIKSSLKFVTCTVPENPYWGNPVNPFLFCVSTKIALKIESLARSIKLTPFVYYKKSLLSSNVRAGLKWAKAVHPEKATRSPALA